MYSTTFGRLFWFFFLNSILVSISIEAVGAFCIVRFYQPLHRYGCVRAPVERTARKPKEDGNKINTLIWFRRSLSSTAAVPMCCVRCVVFVAARFPYNDNVIAIRFIVQRIYCHREQRNHKTRRRRTVRRRSRTGAEGEIDKYIINDIFRINFYNWTPLDVDARLKNEKKKSIHHSIHSIA